MDLSTQLENNEQRCRYGSACQLQRNMPGEQTLGAGVHTIGAIPVGAVLESFNVLSELWDTDITVNIGTAGDPTLFFNGATLVNNTSLHNAQDAPLEFYFPEGEEIVCEILTGNAGANGALEFVVDYSELDTNCGAYTA